MRWMKQATLRLVPSIVVALASAGLAPSPSLAAFCSVAQQTASTLDIKASEERRKTLIAEIKRLQEAIKQVQRAIASGDPGILGQLANALKDLGPVPGVASIPLEALDTLFGGDTPDPRLLQLQRDLMMALKQRIDAAAAEQAKLEELIDYLQECARRPTSEELEALLFTAFVAGETGGVESLLEFLAEANPRRVSQIVRDPRQAYLDAILDSYAETPEGSAVASIVEKTYGALLSGGNRIRQRSAIAAILDEAHEDERKTALRVLIDWLTRQRNSARGAEYDLPGLSSGIDSIGDSVALLGRLLAGESAPSAPGLSLSDGGGAGSSPSDE